MRRSILMITSATLLAGAVAEADARPRRPRKPVEHYTFRPERLAEQTAAYRDQYEWTILRNTLATRVAAGDAFCRLEWAGRRIDVVFNETTEPHRVEIPLPRGATVEDVTAYAIGSDGKKAKKIKSPATELIGDSLLVVTVKRDDKQPVIEIAYDLEGAGISVDETFAFQPHVPVLDARYSFSVSRDLWQSAAAAGMAWDFQASTQPNGWTPKRDDTPDLFTWYWEEKGLEPVRPNRREKPKEVSVTGFLPNALLAGFSSDDLPDVRVLDDVLAFQQRLERLMSAGQLSDGPASIATAPSQPRAPTRDTRGESTIINNPVNK